MIFASSCERAWWSSRVSALTPARTRFLATSTVSPRTPATNTREARRRFWASRPQRRIWKDTRESLRSVSAAVGVRGIVSSVETHLSVIELRLRLRDGRALLVEHVDKEEEEL